MARTGEGDAGGGGRRRGVERDRPRRRELLAAARVPPGGASPGERSRHAPVEPARIRRHGPTIRGLPDRPPGLRGDGPGEDLRAGEPRDRIRQTRQGGQRGFPDAVGAVVEAEARGAEGHGGKLGVLPRRARVPTDRGLLRHRNLSTPRRARPVRRRRRRAEPPRTEDPFRAGEREAGRDGDVSRRRGGCQRGDERAHRPPRSRRGVRRGAACRGSGGRTRRGESDAGEARGVRGVRGGGLGIRRVQAVSVGTRRRGRRRRLRGRERWRRPRPGRRRRRDRVGRDWTRPSKDSTRRRVPRGVRARRSRRRRRRAGRRDYQNRRGRPRRFVTEVRRRRTVPALVDVLAAQTGRDHTRGGARRVRRQVHRSVLRRRV